jgi:flagellar hook-basal body protein
MINGGNVQTSAALGVKTPEYLRQGATVEVNGTRYTVQNDRTYPAWFYEANGGDFAAAAGQTVAEIEADPGLAWPNGFQGSVLNPNPVPVTLDSLPRPGENYPATLDTPLEQLYFYNGNQWTKMFENLKEGDEITLGFEKGGSAVEATFIYNHPGSTPPFGGQQKLDVEKSYTLEHLLNFLGGDVDQPGAAATRITPAMFGAPVTADHPDGDPDDPAFDKNAYSDALANHSLAKSDRNLGTGGGVMGLIDLPPNIGADKGGSDAANSPMETAGAFTRTGVSKAEYLRWDPLTQKFAPVSAASFNVSFVSNLGSENAISNLSVTHNNVTHKSLFSEEKEYAAPEGGSATTDIVVYDSLGNAKSATLRLTLVAEDSNFSTWRWYADSRDDTDFGWLSDDDGNLVGNLSVGTGLIRFDSDGNFVAGSETSETGGIVINQANQGVDDPILVRVVGGMSSGQDLDFSALTQNARASDLSSTQNGSAPGTLDKYEVGDDGVIYGVYSTGATVTLGRLIVGTVSNPNGLTCNGGNLFYTSPASGEMQFGFAGLGGRGDIKQYNLEASNVEMADEFTRMISLQRGYQANTRIITTADEMIQELLNLKR